MSGAESAKTLGERVKSLRNHLGLTQEQLSKKATVSKSFLSEVESGSSEPRGPILVKLARALDASLDYLMTGESGPSARKERVEIPRELDALAKRKDIPYAHVTLLIGFADQVEAMRRANQHHWTEDEWESFYDSVKTHFAKILAKK